MHLHKGTGSWKHLGAAGALAAAAGTGIQATMLAHAAGWSRLFGVPYTSAFNLQYSGGL